VFELAGRRSDDELRAAIAEADVVINLRNPHFGESSASLLNALVAGVPTVVWDHGCYGEFPDDVVVRIRAEGELGPALLAIVRDPDRRRRMGAAAREHSLARFDTALYCNRLRHFVEEVRRRAPLTALTDRVSDHLIELGSSDRDGLAARFATELARLAEEPDPQPASDRQPPSDREPLIRPRLYRAA
jgi:hypothetical protein